MEDAHRRKKQPEFVRKTILEQAARIASSGGLSQLTIAGVAKASGVTKGGLFYHFPNKSLLIESMLDYLLAELDNQIDAYMADDPMPYGRFTRAYVKTVFDDTKKPTTHAIHCSFQCYPTPAFKKNGSYGWKFVLQGTETQMVLQILKLFVWPLMGCGLQ